MTSSTPARSSPRPKRRCREPPAGVVAPCHCLRRGSPRSDPGAGRSGGRIGKFLIWRQRRPVCRQRDALGSSAGADPSPAGGASPTGPHLQVDPRRGFLRLFTPTVATSARRFFAVARLCHRPGRQFGARGRVVPRPEEHVPNRRKRRFRGGEGRAKAAQGRRRDCYHGRYLRAAVASRRMVSARGEGRPADPAGSAQASHHVPVRSEDRTRAKARRHRLPQRHAANCLSPRSHALPDDEHARSRRERSGDNRNQRRKRPASTTFAPPATSRS